jgi:hypothetical protein
LELERTVATSSKIEGAYVFMPIYELDELARGIRRRLKSPNGKSVTVPVKFLERALVIIEKAVDALDIENKEQLSKEVVLMELEDTRIYPPKGKACEKKIKKKATRRRV